jgi:hypothetical protein
MDLQGRLENPACKDLRATLAKLELKAKKEQLASKEFKAKTV